MFVHLHIIDFSYLGWDKKFQLFVPHLVHFLSCLFVHRMLLCVSEHHYSTLDGNYNY